MFKEGAAIGWLNSIFRNEIFNHGIYGDQQIQEEECLLKKIEFDFVSSSLRNRYATRPDLLSVPDFSQVLFGWYQSGDEGKKEVKNWIAENTNSDSGFLTVLEQLKGWASSSDIGIYYPLHPKTIAMFFDENFALSRLNNLSKTDDALSFSNRAKKLQEAISMSKR